MPASPAWPVDPERPAAGRRAVRGRLDIACDVESGGHAGFAGVAGRSRTARRWPEASGGPEGKLRGRPPPPVEPRSGPWRRTGSEFDAGRAQTRRELSMTDAARGGLARDPKRRREARRPRGVHRRTERDAERVAARAEAGREADDPRAV